MIQWPIMKASLEDLVRRYPDSYNWSLAASGACLFRDAVFFQYSMSAIFFPTTFNLLHGSRIRIPKAALGSYLLEITGQLHQDGFASSYLRRP